MDNPFTMGNPLDKGNPFSQQPLVPFSENVEKTMLSDNAKCPPVRVADNKLTDDQVYFNEIDSYGNVGKFKMESGVPVKVADLGNIKDFFNRAIMKAAIMTPEEIMQTDFGDMTHIEIAAIKMAAYAAAGDLNSMKELFDRVLGKAKQVSESTNLNLTLDDILNGVQAKGDVIDVGP